MNLINGTVKSNFICFFSIHKRPFNKFIKINELIKLNNGIKLIKLNNGIKSHVSNCTCYQKALTYTRNDLRSAREDGNVGGEFV